jgi:hypothetical protein
MFPEARMWLETAIAVLKLRKQSQYLLIHIWKLSKQLAIFLATTRYDPFKHHQPWPYPRAM